MRDGMGLYLIVWLGARVHHAHESLQRQWCTVLRLSLGKVIEMRRLWIFGEIYRANSSRSAAKVTPYPA